MNQPELELLISRLCEADAGADEWSSFESMAESDPALWRVLATMQRQHALLAAALDQAVAIADSVELPSLGDLSGAAQARGRADSAGAVLSAPRRVHHAPFVMSVRRSWLWTGWAAAAVVALSWIAAWGLRTGSMRPRLDDTSAERSVPLANFSPQEALQTYLEKGRESGLVLGEVPTKVLLEARPAPSGEGYELLYLRQVLERTLVPDLYEIEGQDEQGRPTLVRLEHAPDRPM